MRSREPRGEARNETGARRGSGRRRLLARAAVALAAVPGGALLLSACLLARPAPSRVGPPPPELGARAVTFPSASGATVSAWLVPGRPGAGAVLLLHGVHANRLVMRDRTRWLARDGYAVLLPDFQAHGETPGRRITYGLLESRDAAAALAFLRGEAPGERVGVIGVSMGGAAALVGPGPLAADALVLESVYPTIAQATRDRLRVWLGPLRPLAPFATAALLRVVGGQIGVGPDSLRPIDRIGRAAAPLLVASGTEDRYTTIGEARALFAAAPVSCAPKEFWAVPGAGHVDLHDFAPAEYERRVGAFLARYLRGVPGASGAGPGCG